MRWELVKQYTLLPRINMIDGYHPDRDKILAKGAGNASHIAASLMDIRDDHVSQELFDRITILSQESVQEAIKVCEAEGIDKSSLRSVMESYGYELNETNTRFVKAQAPSRVVQQRATEPMTQQPATYRSNQPIPQPSQAQMPQMPQMPSALATGPASIEADLDDLSTYFSR